MASVPEDEVTATEHQVDVETAGNGDQQDLEGQLKDLIAQATSKYAIKDYNTAAELYSQATELQAELRGEMAIENADLLYAYGKCLYFVAVSKSDVLGTKAAGDKMSNPKEEKKTKGKRKSALEASSTSAPARENQDQRVAEEIVAAIVTEKDAEGKVDLPSDAKAQKTGDKPFFQFTGDENWDDSDDEEEADEEDGEEEEEEDEFSNAFEILDIARVLLNKRLEQLQDTALAQAGKGKSKELVGTDTPELRLAKERLADTHDLQAEISLEGERFPNAVVDLRAALELKQGLYPQESSQIAECHYKLSLALEFASVTQQKEENEEAAETKPAVVDEAMRKEAAEEMEKAIESCEARIKKEQAELNSRPSGPASTDNGEPRRKPITQKDIDEVKELVADMRQRVSVLSIVFHPSSPFLSSRLHVP